MECPVCKSEISFADQKCPQCEADLEAIQLSSKIENDNKQKFSFGIIMTLLFLAVTVIWVSTGMKRGEQPEEIVDKTEYEQLKRELAETNQLNEVLKNENEKLQLKLSEETKPTAKKSMEYIVKEGESMFIIARKIYGNGFKYTDLATDNQIQNPDKIRTGQKLVVYY